MTSKVRLGTRGSRLAMAQAHTMQEMLTRQHPGLSVEIVPIKTSGDRGDRELVGAFVREIQQALLSDQIDLALHCLKDLPTQPVSGLHFAAYLERANPADLLIGAASLNSLPSGATVGTGSVRRTGQIAAIRPDIRFKPLVGNVDTRLRKLLEGEYDAIILAIAGLQRLGLLDGWQGLYPGLEYSELGADLMLPAPGQAVLVLESREDDERARQIAAPFHHEMSCLCASAERLFLEAFGGGCSVPVAALGRAQGDEVLFEGLVASPDGKRVLRGRRQVSSDQVCDAAKELAEELIGQGALELFTVREGLRS